MSNVKGCENTIEGDTRTCYELFDCCRCGVTIEDRNNGKGCLCRYCFDCNACEHCKQEEN